MKSKLVAKLNRVKEKETQKLILDWLRMHKVFCFKYNSGGIFRADGSGYMPTGMRGISDILGVVPNIGGQFLAIEVKSSKGIVSKYQQDFMDNINNNGGLAFMARSLDEVIEVLKDYVN